MENELKHWGVLGMKWGVRRYQNPDGTLTSEGKKRYGVSSMTKSGVRLANKMDKKLYKVNKMETKVMRARSKISSKITNRYDKKINKAMKKGYSDKVSKLQNKKQIRLKDYNDGTKVMQKGYDEYSKIISKYRNVKLKSYNDRTFKKDQKYKRAVKNYVNQVVADLSAGRNWTILSYAGQHAAINLRNS